MAHNELVLLLLVKSGVKAPCLTFKCLGSLGVVNLFFKEPAATRAISINIFTTKGKLGFLLVSIECFCVNSLTMKKVNAYWGNLFFCKIKGKSLK
jgi:hypothetical protein